jgi:signal transduction histidine kinase
MLSLQLVEQRQHDVPLEKLARSVDSELDPLRTLMDGKLDRLVALEQLQLQQAEKETVRGTSAAFRLACGLFVGAMLFASGLVWTAVQGERTRRKASEFERQLVGIVTHDLRSPLTAILLATRSLLRKAEAGPATSALERIERSARRLESVTHLLLDFTRARLGAGIPVVPEPVDLQMLCHDAVEEARAGEPERLIQEDYAGDLQGQWDAARLSQVLANLLQNALKYSPPDTPVQVRATVMEGGVRVEVHNQGEPIPRELLPRLFEPFQSGARNAKTVKKSLGLGLDIIREIVQAHAGTISVRSEPGQGTLFTLTLPRRIGRMEALLRGRAGAEREGRAADGCHWGCALGRWTGGAAPRRNTPTAAQSSRGVRSFFAHRGAGRPSRERGRHGPSGPAPVHAESGLG